MDILVIAVILAVALVVRTVQNWMEFKIMFDKNQERLDDTWHRLSSANYILMRRSIRKN